MYSVPLGGKCCISAKYFGVGQYIGEASIRAMGLPAADCFLEEFLPAFSLTLDEQDA